MFYNVRRKVKTKRRFETGKCKCINVVQDATPSLGTFRLGKGARGQGDTIIHIPHIETGGLGLTQPVPAD